jgi:uncharacterized membrane protein
MKNSIVIAMSAAISLSVATSVQAADSTAMPAGMEKCAPTKVFIKAGKGSCDTAKNSCAGNNSAKEAGAWIVAPQGTCANIDSGNWKDVPKDICDKLDGVDVANCKQ